MNGFDSPGHVAVVSSVAFSRDGRFVASCSWDDTIRVWDAGTGNLLNTLDLHEPGRSSLLDTQNIAFLRGDRILLAICRSLWIWSPRRTEPESFPDKRAEHALVFDGGVITYEREGSVISIWDAHARTLVRTVEFPGVKLVQPAVSPCGRFFAFLEGRRCRIVRLPESSVASRVFVPRGWAALSFSPSGCLLGYAGHDEPPIVVETATGRVVAALGSPKHPRGFGPCFHHLVRFAHENRVATAGYDGCVRLWSLPDGREELNLTAPGVLSERIAAATHATEIGAAAHSAWIRDIAFAPGGEVLASTGDDHVVRLWDARSGALLRVLGEPRNTIHALAAHGDRIASGHEDGTLRIWDVPTRCLRASTKAHVGRVNGLGFSGAGLLASCGSDGYARLWEGSNLDSLRVFPRDHTSAQALVLSPDGLRVCLGGWREIEGTHGRRCLLTERILGTGDRGSAYEDRDNAPQRMPSRAHYVRAMAMHPSGTLLAASVWSEVKLWHTETGTTAGTLRASEGVSLAFSPDGHRLAVGLVGWSIQIWDMKARALALQFGTGGDSIGGLTFTPDGGSIVLVTDYDNSVWIHDASNGKLVERLDAHRASLRALAVSGNLLATGGQDGSIQLWSMGCWKNLGHLWHPSAARPEGGPS